VLLDHWIKQIVTYNSKILILSIADIMNFYEYKNSSFVKLSFRRHCSSVYNLAFNDEYVAVVTFPNYNVKLQSIDGEFSRDFSCFQCDTLTFYENQLIYSDFDTLNFIDLESFEIIQKWQFSSRQISAITIQNNILYLVLSSGLSNINYINTHKLEKIFCFREYP
jgi:hypothetical protein